MELKKLLIPFNMLKQSQYHKYRMAVNNCYGQDPKTNFSFKNFIGPTLMILSENKKRMFFSVK